MQISHYTSLIYVFVGIIASVGIFLSRTSGERRLIFFNGGKPSLWFVSALSIFASSLFQFWILLLPVISLSLSGLFIILSLIISLIFPIFLVKNGNAVIYRFMEMLSTKLKTILSLFVIIFLLIIQPFALLYLGEKIIAQFLDGSYHFLLVFLIGAAGLSTLIGGKRVVVYSNAMFGVVVIASMLEIMYLGKSFSAPLMFLQSLFTEGTQYFQNHNFIETNWIIGFIGFSVITWWMWWIDNSAFHLQGKQSEQRNSNLAMFASFSLIVIALVVLPTQSHGEISRVEASTVSLVLVNNELLGFFFVLGFISVMVSAFSHSFHTVATIVAIQYFRDEIHQGVEEKHILIARLVIVLSALLTILGIPFAQFFGAATLLVFVQYLSCFAASMVGVFTAFVFWKKNYKGGITAGVVGGLSAGIIIALLTHSGTEIFIPLLTTPYGAATVIFFFSIVCSIAGSFFVERKIVKGSIAA